MLLVFSFQTLRGTDFPSFNSSPGKKIQQFANFLSTLCITKGGIYGRPHFSLSSTVPDLQLLLIPLGEHLQHPRKFSSSKD